MTTPSSFSFAHVVRFLYTQNPFYLLGTLLVLFGLQQAVGSDLRVASSGLLTGLLAAYALLLAGIAVLVIRGGQVWDDARTILLVIVLLLFMLSASLDFHLAATPWLGTVLAFAGLALAMLLSEGLLRTLRIHLALRYRGPYYLMLTLLFVYPVAPAWLTHLQLADVRPWAMLAFPLLFALALLTLLPAARTRRREPASNTPWIWPYYPWSLFLFLTVGVAIRAWWLTISFEPLMGTESYFRPYFLLPIWLAWSALVLEIGRARGSRGAIVASQMLPLAGLYFGFSGSAHNPIEAAFLERLVSTVGSPAQIAVMGLMMYYGYAWLRKVPSAEGALIALGLLASVIGRDTFTLSTLVRPQPLPLVCVAAALLLLAARKRSTWRAVAGGAMVIAGGRYAGVGLLDASTLGFWQWHGPVLGLMALTTIFNDDLAKLLREIAWRAAPCLAIVAAVVYPWILPTSTTVLASYLVLMLLVSIALWQKQREIPPLISVLATLAANVLFHFQNVYVLLQHSLLAGGLPWLTGGLVMVLLALSISLLKMGLWQQARAWLEQLNLTLGGAAKP